MGIKKGLDHSWKAWGHWNNVKELLSLAGYWPLLPGWGGGAVTFIWTAAAGWSAPAVWLASLAAAALCAVIFAAIRIAIVYSRGAQKSSSSIDVGVDKIGTLTITQTDPKPWVPLVMV